MPEPAPFDPERIITTLARHGVRYVLIGAVAARLQGFPRLTADADITPAQDQENLMRLARALTELDARADLWNLATSAGRLDLAFRPSGTDGYDDLIRTAVPFQIHGVRIEVASLEDIIRSKIAADRPQDRQDVVVLREMLRREREALP